MDETRCRAKIRLGCWFQVLRVRKRQIFLCVSYNHSSAFWPRLAGQSINQGRCSGSRRWSEFPGLWCPEAAWWWGFWGSTNVSSACWQGFSGLLSPYS